MKTNNENSHWRNAARALVIGVTVCAAATAHAESAARKLGQVGLINQTLQPKPPKSSPAYEPNNSSTYNANARNGVNAGNAAAATPPAGAYPLKPNTQ
jgi:hypothetical protein